MKISKQTGSPSLIDTLNAVKRDVGININCIQIGIIQEFFPETQTANIKFALKKVVKIDTDGTRYIEERPLLIQCPVVTLFGGNAFLSMPIQAGDNCLLLFNDRQIDEWFLNGGVQVPTSERIHDLSDAIAIVGIRNLQNTIADYLENGIRLSYSANSRIDLTEDNINSIADLFKHDGDFQITENLLVEGNMSILGEVFGNGSGELILNATLIQNDPSDTIKVGNGATGTFDTVTVVDGIVVGGS